MNIFSDLQSKAIKTNHSLINLTSELQPCTNAVPDSYTAVIIQYNPVITDSKDIR